MAAPVGNKFWEARSSHGRRPIFASPEQLRSAALEYIKWADDNPLWEQKVFNGKDGIVYASVSKMRAMTIGGLCIFLDIDRTTWSEYGKKEDFSTVVREIDEIIRDQKFSGAAADLLNANIIARDLGLADKQDLSSSDGTMTPAPNIDASKLSVSTLEELLAARNAATDK